VGEAHLEHLGLQVLVVLVVVVMGAMGIVRLPLERMALVVVEVEVVVQEIHTMVVMES